MITTEHLALAFIAGAAMTFMPTVIISHFTLLLKYRLGVLDGYGYAVYPDRPQFSKAGEIIEKIKKELDP